MTSSLRLYTLLWTLLASPFVTQRTSSAQRPEVWAFTGPWDRQSDASLRSYGASLDAVVTGWIGLDSVTAMPILPSLFPDTIRPRTRTPVSWRRMAIVTAWHGDRFHPRTVRRLAAESSLLARAAHAVATHAEEMRYGGLVLDFESLERSDLESLVRVVRVLTDSAHAHGVSPVTLAIPAADTIAYPARPLLGATDLLLPMLYDQHWAEGEPGPIADPAWVRSMLAIRVREAGAGRLVAGLPTYGYRWIRGRPTEHLSFADARRIAKRTGIPLTRDTSSQTLRAVRRRSWEMWVSDAGQLRALLTVVRQTGVGRVALWRLGQEDERIWALFRRTN